jgi:hypothetical protein
MISLGKCVLAFFFIKFYLCYYWYVYVAFYLWEDLAAELVLDLPLDGSYVHTQGANMSLIKGISRTSSELQSE